VIREIKNIRPSHKFSLERMEKNKALKKHNQNEETQKPKKHNIFDQTDKNSLKHQRFKSIGYDDKTAIMPFKPPV
jgi:hypothetical protein